MFKKWLRIFLLSFVLMYSSCEIVGAVNCLEPMPVPGYEYLSIQYDPYGNALVFIDRDGDSKADFVVGFRLVKNTETGEVLYVPEIQMTPKQGKMVMDKADEYNKAQGFKGKCYDTETEGLVNESDRWS